MGRVTLREGAVVDEPGVVALPPLPDAADAAALVAAFEASLAEAARSGSRAVAQAVAPRGALALQRRAELLLAAAQAATGDGGPLDFVCFWIEGEPSYRIFEGVQDAARIAEQMARLRR
jgi:hypothetical protein